MKAKIEPQGIIEAYENGQSLNAIARAFGTYPTTVRRILERNDIKLRHDAMVKGSHTVLNDGEKLIEWAKSQGRLVSRKELAKVLGKKRLSPSYFIKYPELGQYVITHEQKDILEYSEKLYKWLKENNIPYKPNDRTKLGLSVNALLLEEYTGLAIDIFIKPVYVSKRKHEEDTKTKMRKAKENDITIIFLNEEHFKNLDEIKGLLDSLKHD